VIGDRDFAIVEPLSLGSGPHAVVVKDVIDIKGLPTRQGSRVLADAPPAVVHAAVVSRLLASKSWRIVGKANLHEFAFGVTGVNSWTGTPRNPLWPDRIPGGSSSGSASAVASGVAAMSLGSDTGGSVRMPAACCGVIGLKPSFGLISREGAYPIESSLDCIGVFARDMALVDLAMAELAPEYTPVAAPGGIRLGVVEVVTEPEVGAAIGRALRKIGPDLEPVRLPSLEAAFNAGVVIIGAENWKALGRYVDHPNLGVDVRARLSAAAKYSEVDIEAAEVVRERFREEVDRVLDSVDALALPTLPTVPPTLEQALDARACVPLTRLVRPFNLSGHPAISLPLRTRHGLPAALQLVGRRGRDAQLCALARFAMQRVRDDA
jgi:amidase